MLPLEMEQVCEEKETVTVEAVKLAWEQAKKKVEIWKETAAQMEKKDVHLIQDEERAEQALLMTEGHGDDNRHSCWLQIAFYFIAIVTSFLSVMFVGGAPDKEAGFLIVQLLPLGLNAQASLIVGCAEGCGACGEFKLRVNSEPKTFTGWTIFSTLVFASSLIITVAFQSWYKENGQEWLFIATIVNLTLGLTVYLVGLVIGLVHVMINYNKAQSSKIKELAQMKIANTIDAAVTVTRGWAASKSANLQKLLTTNDTPQVNLKTLLAAAPKIETVIQICEKAQTMCQAAVSNPSTAAEQATEILQAIVILEGLLPEVEGMLPQLLHHPDIQMEEKKQKELVLVQ
jgi:hypothetical protein